MTARGLGGLQASHLADVERDMEFPLPFVPQDRKHKPSQVFLRRERIYDLWHPNSHMKLGLIILDHPKLRKAVEAIILSPFRIDKAKNKLNRTVGEETGIKLTTRSIELFAHYFWNQESMTASDWGEFVESSRAAGSEWIDLAVKVSGPNSGNMLLWKMGIGTLRRMEGHRAYLDTRNTAIAAIAQIAHEDPSLNHSKMLLNYARVLDMAHKGVDATGGSREDMVNSFRNFKLQHEETEIPPVFEVTGGNLSLPEVGTEDGLDED